MIMKITFLGTGTSTGVPQLGCKCEVCHSEDVYDKRLRSSIMVESQNKRVLVDCTPDFRTQMLNQTFQKIDALFLTHEHYDHVGGIDDLRPYSQHFGGIDIYAEENVMHALNSRIAYCFKENKYAGIPNIKLHKINIESHINIGSINITPIRVMHHKLPIVGYRINNTAYITDIKTLPESEYHKLQNLDVFIVSALRKTPHISHQTLEEAIALSKLIKPKKTFFTHMSHEIGFHNQISKELPKNMYLAHDTLELTI